MKMFVDCCYNIALYIINYFFYYRSILSEDSARKTSPTKENKSCQTPPKSQTTSQGVQTPQELERLPTKRGLCFDDELNTQNKRRKQNIEQQETSEDTVTVRPTESNTAVTGRAKGFLDGSSSPANSKSTDESAVLPPGKV